MNYTEKARLLRQNLIVMKETFEEHNLRVLSLGCRPFDEEEDGDYKVYVEIAAISGGRIENDYLLNVNIYDEHGDLFDTTYRKIYKDSFNDYETLDFVFTYGNKALDYASRGKLYITNSQ